MLARLVGIERRVNPAEYHRGTALAREPAKVIPAQRVGGMNANAHNVTRTRHSPSRMDSSVSSTITGVPYCAGVAAASTYNQRGVITAVPKEMSEGLTMCMRIDAGLYQKTPLIDLLNFVKNPAVAIAAFCVPFPTVTPASAAAPQGVGARAGRVRPPAS